LRSYSYSTHGLPIYHVFGAPPSEGTSNKPIIDLQKTDLTCMTDSSMIMKYRKVVGVENVGGKVYGKATESFNKHYRYSEQWNRWPASWSMYEYPQALLFQQHMKILIDYHLRYE